MLGLGAVARIPSATAFTRNISDTLDDITEHVGVGIVTDPGGGSTQIFGDGTTALGYLIHIGLRFQNITIPKNAVINTATITLNQAKHPAQTGVPTGTWSAWAVDDAAIFSGGNLPSTVSKTTATHAFVAAATGTKAATVHNVKNIVQELVNRAGWASGNDINFACISGTPGNIALDIWDDTQTTTPVVAKLDVNYS